MADLNSIFTGLSMSVEKTEKFVNEICKLLEGEGFLLEQVQLVGESLPQLLTLQQIKLRKFKNHCRSCIITDTQVEQMASYIYEVIHSEHKLDVDNEQEIKAFEELSEADKKQYYEWVYAIPVVFKQLGYELFRPAEDDFLNEELAEQLVRIIHARFKKHMLNETSTDIYQGMYLVSGNQETFTKEFDELTDDIKAANVDNAYHIPSKLLAIGYIMVKTEADVPPLLRLSDNEVEAMSIIEHDRWSWERRLNGWTYNEIRNNDLKQHNCLVPYDELPPHEQEKDRIMVRFIPALLVDIGYQVTKVSPELANEISYINQQNGYVFEAETQVRNLQNLITQQNDDIQKHFDDVFNKIHSVEDLKKEITGFHKYLSKQYLHSSLQRLETTNSLLKHIKGTFKSGQYVQKTFMPQSVELKEYFPESFILFKPQDIVSGDFYFIAKQNDWIIYADADCTGHGISGSILSGICYNYLHEAVNQNSIENPADILQYVMPRVKQLLRHDNKVSGSGSEMELAICAINMKTNLLNVASYGRPVYAFLKGEFTQLGKVPKAVEPNLVHGFHTQQIQLTKGDTLYAFSDGYPDQLGGPDGRKFMTKNFKKLLADIQGVEMQEQCQILNNEIEDWQKCEGKYIPHDNTVIEDQTDDISIIGIKI